jgi:hypothetical protein
MLVSSSSYWEIRPRLYINIISETLTVSFFRVNQSEWWEKDKNLVNYPVDGDKSLYKDGLSEQI